MKTKRVVTQKALLLAAGVYFAFIMRSLDHLGAVPATDAMNAINEVILRSWFMTLFFKRCPRYHHDLISSFSMKFQMVG